MRQPVKQTAYKHCINLAKTEFPYQLTLSLRCKYSRSNFQDAINSICRSAAASDCKPMTSVFYMTSFVLSPFADAQTCLQAIFDGFFRNLNPKMLSAIVWTPKKALPCVTTRFGPSRVKFHARVTSVGESGKQ